jgi:hypothetical protein
MKISLSPLQRVAAGSAVLGLLTATALWIYPSQAPVSTTSAPSSFTAAATPDHPDTPLSSSEPALVPAAKTAPASKRVFAAAGKPSGAPLPPQPPAIRDGHEKGRILPLEKISPEALGELVAGDSLALPTPEGDIRGVVNLVVRDENGWVRVGGDLPDRSGTFMLASSPESAGGNLLLPQDRRAYELLMDSALGLLLVERRLSDLRCFSIQPRTEAAGPVLLNASKVAPVAGAAQAPPLLSSRPNAPAVVYLDFDGETITDPSWNGGRSIVAPAMALTAAQMTEIFNRVREDYAPFNVDITTNLARYNAVPANRRTRCIVTSNDAAAPGAGGVAYVDAFSLSGSVFSSTIPCWVFNSGAVGIAEAISHEVGHTLGLDHDGRSNPREEYYAGAGAGPTGWAPIMGVGYNRQLVQWSKGEYANADNRQDDLAIITKAANGVSYMTDDAGNTTAAAAPLGLANNSINQSGLITSPTDSDLFRFEASGGTLSATANPATVSPNLDIKLELLNSAGVVMATGNPVDALPASLSSNLAAGTYFLRVTGTGKGNVLTNGYSSYGSIGAYTLTGSVNGVAVPQPPSITSSGSAAGQVGSPFSYQITATNSPTSYSLTGSLPGGLALNSATGLISGTPTAAGNSSVTLRATNAQGTGTLALNLAISAAPVPLSTAIDLSTGTVTSTGNLPWATQNSVTFDSVDAAVSGKITHNQKSILVLNINGPGVLDFRWRVDSEANYDKLSLVLDGAVREFISGNTAWALRSLPIPAGLHKVEWRYEKDVSVSAGADAGWVDTVALRPVDALRLSGTLGFGKVAVGTTAQRQMTIFNDGPSPIDVSSISYPPGFSGPFTGQIASGSSRTVQVTFAPTAAQLYSGNLTVNSNATSGTKTLALSGEGIAAVTPLSNNVPIPNLSGTQGSQAVYKITVPAGTTKLEISTTGPNGDADLYIKRGAAPTLAVSDFKADGNTSNELVAINNPAAADWFVLVHAYAAYSGLTIKAVCSASFQINLSTSGQGSVSGAGAYSAGSNLTINATPSAGNRFVNWTENGAVASASAAYTFTVNASRSLVANFAPLADGSTLTNGVPIGNLQAATGTTTLYRIPVPANTRSLTITTSGGTGDVDLYLNRGSAPTTRSFYISSSGPATNESLVVISPSAGDWYVLLHAYSPYSGVSIVARTALAAGFTRAADRAANPAFVDRAGAYQGLVGSELTAPVLGTASIAVSKRGTFTLETRIPSGELRFRGTLDDSGTWSGSVTRGRTQASLLLNLDLAGNSGVTGTLSLNGQILPLAAQTRAKDTSPIAGLYEVALPADPEQDPALFPQGNGTALCLVLPNGRLILKGMLGDGTLIQLSSTVSAEGESPLFAKLYRSRGFLGGWARFSKEPNSLSGSMLWVKPANPRALQQPAGFTGVIPMTGHPLPSQLRPE